MRVLGRPHFTNQLSVDALAFCSSKTYNVSIFLIGPSSLFSLHRTSNCSMSPAYYFSCVHQSREELSNLNGNEKHETGRKVIGATFYVPISIFTATKHALWEYMNIHGYTILNNLALLDVYSLQKCFPRLGWVILPA